MKVRQTNKKVGVPLNPDGTVQKNRKRAYSGTSEAWDSEIKGSGKKLDNVARVEGKSGQNEDTLGSLKEQNDATASHSKLPDQYVMRRNAETRKGKVMHHFQFLKKLRKAGIKAWYNVEPFQGVIGLRCVRKGFERLGAQYICAVKLGWTTEYCFFHYDSHGVELNKKFIGWRSVLIQMISNGILTEQKAHEIFGKPQICEGSSIYRRELSNIRNNRGQIKA